MSNTPKKEVIKKDEVSEGITVVTFIRPIGRYSNGDTATFSVEQCAAYIKSKAAVAGDKLPAVKKED